MNCPIWLPIESNMSSNSGSSLRTSRLKNSITPITWSPLRTRKRKRRVQSLFRSQSRAAENSGLPGTSGSHAGCTISHTHPGRPTPFLYAIFRVSASKRGKLNCGKCHIFVQRNAFSDSFTRHSAPSSHPSPSQIDIRSAAPPPSSESASASTRVTAYPVACSRSACFRCVMSRATAKINFCYTFGVAFHSSHL